MELRDLIVTPFVILVVYAAAYWARPRVCDSWNYVYFFPALTVKIIGALALGLLYQFYYDGGDTFNYHTHGSRVLWEAFADSPEKGFQLFFNTSGNYTGVYEYASRIYFISDPKSFAIIKLLTILDLFTFSSYSGTAVLFAVIGFAGGWMLFLSFYRLKPHLHFQIAFATLFIPSVIFWGSGVLKDTITLSCLGAATYCIFVLSVRKRFLLIYIAVLLLSLYVLYVVKIYILLTFLPASIMWVFFRRVQRIRSTMLKVVSLPFVLVLAAGLGYYAIVEAVKDNPKYSLEMIAKTAQITAYDIRYFTGRDAGSGYDLGVLDGSLQGLVRLSPQAINVSLFRPYLWELNNPLMFASALEAFALLILTCYTLLKCRLRLFPAMMDPYIMFCLIFSISFAFAVGVSTFNFGTLTRYKIPMLPYYAMALILIIDYVNNDRKVPALEDTE